MTMLETTADLIAWLERAGEQHIERDGNCSCGWEAKPVTPFYDSSTEPWTLIDIFPGTTFADHLAGAVLDDLAEVLPSRTRTSDGWVSVAQIQTDLYDTIDCLHEEADAMVDLAAELGLCLAAMLDTPSAAGKLRAHAAVEAWRKTMDQSFD